MVRLNVVLAALLVLCSLMLVTSQHSARKLYAQREHERARMLELRAQSSSLEKEQNTLATAEGIARQARQKLRMELVPAERTLHLSVQPASLRRPAPASSSAGDRAAPQVIASRTAR